MPSGTDLPQSARPTGFGQAVPWIFASAAIVMAVYAWKSRPEGVDAASSPPSSAGAATKPIAAVAPAPPTPAPVAPAPPPAPAPQPSVAEPTAVPDLSVLRSAAGSLHEIDALDPANADAAIRLQSEIAASKIIVSLAAARMRLPPAQVADAAAAEAFLVAFCTLPPESDRTKAIQRDLRRTGLVTALRTASSAARP